MRAGFPHSEICGSKLVCQLPAAYRKLLRPSSPVIAKASTICTYSLDPITLKPRAGRFRPGRSTWLQEFSRLCPNPSDLDGIGSIQSQPMHRSWEIDALASSELLKSEQPLRSKDQKKASWLACDLSEARIRREPLSSYGCVSLLSNWWR